MEIAGAITALYDEPTLTAHALLHVCSVINDPKSKKASSETEAALTQFTANILPGFFTAISVYNHVTYFVLSRDDHQKTCQSAPGAVRAAVQLLSLCFCCC